MQCKAIDRTHGYFGLVKTRGSRCKYNREKKNVVFVRLRWSVSGGLIDVVRNGKPVPC